MAGDRPILVVDDDQTLCAMLLEQLAVGRHERVVDIGCGTGATTVQLSAMSAGVVGVDISAPMLAMAQQRAVAVGAPNVEFVETDVEVAPFAQDAFDVAFSRFGVMFFNDPVLGFTHIRRSLVPGGRLGFVCFAEMGENPFMMVPVSAGGAHLPMPPIPGPTAPSPFALADPARTTGVLTSAGFGAVTIQAGPDSVTMGRADDLPAVARRVLEQNPMSGAGMHAATPAEQEAAIAAVIDVLAQHVVDEHVVMAAKTWVVTATAG